MYKYKNVIVSGASSGLGLAFVLELASQGANVICCARRKDILDSLVSDLRIRYESQNFLSVPMDIQNRNEVYEKVNGVLRSTDVDILINCAGIACCDYIENISDEIFENQMKTNYFGTVWLTKSLLAHFKKKKAGAILNISSIAGALGFVGYAAYSPSKFAVCGFSEVIRNELKPFGIRVSLCLPQDLNTPQLGEENKTKPLPTKKVSGSNKPIEPAQAAKMILKSFAKNKFYILLKPDGYFSFYFPRLFPSLSRRIIDWLSWGL